MPDESKIKDRILRLLSMAKDKGSPNEAAIAMRRARALADKHQIELDDIKEDDLISEIYFGYVGEKVAEPWAATLIHAATMLNDCVVQAKNRTGTDEVYFEVSGHEADVEMCFWFCDYLFNTLEEAYQPDSFLTGESISLHDFRIGFCSAIGRRVGEMAETRKKNNQKEKADSKDGKGMIALKQSMVEQKFGETKFKRVDGPSEQVNPIARAMGQWAADEVSLSRRGISKD